MFAQEFHMTLGRRENKLDYVANITKAILIKLLQSISIRCLYIALSHGSENTFIPDFTDSMRNRFSMDIIRHSVRSLLCPWLFTYNYWESRHCDRGSL